MTEQSIFEIILGESDYKLDQINPLLIPYAAQKISSVLAHGSDPTGRHSSYPTNHWKDNLMLLYKLSAKNEAHHHVEGTNISIILDFLGKSFEYKEDDESELIEDWAQEVALKVEKFKADVKKQHHAMEQRKVEHNEFWRNKVKELEMSTGVEWTPPTRRKISKIDPFIFINPFEINGEVPRKKIKSSKDDNYRLQHIQFGYAITNLGSKCPVSKHLIVLLKRLSSYEKMYCYEKRFCKYLFKFLDKTPELLEFYSKQFFFIIEISIIETCTSLLKGTAEDFKTQLEEYVKTEEFKSLKAACGLSSSIKLKVMHALFTLYYFSRLNRRIIRFLREFEDAVPVQI